MLAELPDPPPPMVPTALAGWVGFVEAASLDWAERKPVSAEVLRDLLVGRLAPVVEDYVVETGGGVYLIRVR